MNAMSIPEDFDDPCVALVLSNSEITLVDADAYHELAAFKWHPIGPGYVARNVARPDGLKESEYLHRRINGTPHGLKTDHINTFRKDNRRCNLRTATDAQNFWNQRKRTSGTTSRFKGVSWDGNRKKWRAQIFVSPRVLVIGRFETETEAALAYNEAARLYFGEFARLNEL